LVTQANCPFIMVPDFSLADFVTKPVDPTNPEKATSPKALCIIFHVRIPDPNVMTSNHGSTETAPLSVDSPVG
jgi:hypothetical protein